MLNLKYKVSKELYNFIFVWDILFLLSRLFFQIYTHLTVMLPFFQVIQIEVGIFLCKIVFHKVIMTFGVDDYVSLAVQTPKISCCLSKKKLMIVLYTGRIFSILLSIYLIFSISHQFTQTIVKHFVPVQNEWNLYTNTFLPFC